jgi:uncharacterized protein
MKSNPVISLESDPQPTPFKFWQIFWNPREKRLRSLLRILYFVVILELSALGIALILGWVFQINTDSLATITPSSFVVGSLMNAIIPLGAIYATFWFASRFIDKRSFSNFGFNLSRRWILDLGAGLLLGLVLLAIVYGLEIAAGWLQPIQLNYSTLPQIPFWLGLVMYFIFYVSVGFFEEMLIRGYVLHNLSEGLHGSRLNARWSVVISLFLTSILFGALHFGNPNISVGAIILLSLAGLFLGLAFVLTGNLALSIGIHIAWNFAEGIIFGFPVSGIASEFSVFRGVQSGPTLLTGGNFGPEAGLLGMLIILLGIGLIYVFVRLTRNTVEMQDSLAEYKIGN